MARFKNQFLWQLPGDTSEGDRQRMKHHIPADSCVACALECPQERDRGKHVECTDGNGKAWLRQCGFSPPAPLNPPEWVKPNLAEPLPRNSAFSSHQVILLRKRALSLTGDNSNTNDTGW